uniref:Uncharacterized protein n=1 Tax=Laticauda laticaudata TaxID=8630 RepID=A0A8C5SEY7_LATLA
SCLAMEIWDSIVVNCGFAECMNPFSGFMLCSLLQYTFVGNIFMVPDDPLGRSGPTLADFLKKKTRPPAGAGGDNRRGRQGSPEEKEKLRSTEETEWLRSKLLEIFEGQNRKVDFVLIREPCCQDLNKLSEIILSFTF